VLHRLKAVLLSGWIERGELFGEEAGLRCDCSRGGDGFAACDADDAKNSNLCQCGAGNEYSVGRGVEIGRGDLHAVIQEREQVVGDDAFQDLMIDEPETDPEAVEFGAAQEGFALGLKVVGELANEINGAHLGEGDLFVLAVGSEEIDGIGLA
jgi:hypothetical protein